MRISFLSPVRKTAFLSGSITAALIAWALCWQAFAEYWVSRSGTLEGFEKASVIQPLSADYPRILGAAYIQADISHAVSLLERSKDINPHSAATWLSLAEAYGVTGDITNQREAIVNALQADPKDVNVAWDAAIFFIQNGNVDSALQLMRGAIISDPSRATQAMQIGFRATGGDVQRTLQAVPRTASAHLGLIRWLLDHEHASAADEVWNSLPQVDRRLRAEDVFFYMDSLLSRREINQARSVWNVVTALDPDLQRQTEPGNLITNGSFERNLLNGGFGWRYHRVDGVTVEMDTSSFHSGTRSLGLQFDGSVPTTGLYQLIPVEPGTRYSIFGFIHSEELESANGMRIVITDYYSRNVLFASDEILGSTPWRETGGQFTTAADTKILELSFGRLPALGQIRGKVWIDDIRLEKAP